MDIERIINDLKTEYSFEIDWHIIMGSEREYYLSMLKERLGHDHSLYGRPLYPYAFCVSRPAMVFSDEETGNCYGFDMLNTCRLLKNDEDVEEYIIPICNEAKSRLQRRPERVLRVLLWIGDIILLPGVLWFLGYEHILHGSEGLIFILLYMTAVPLLFILMSLKAAALLIPFLTAAVLTDYMIRYRPKGRELKGIVIQTIIYIVGLAAAIYWYLEMFG